MSAIYKVEIAFLALKDEWENGETGEYGASWDESREFESLAEVKEFVEENTYSGYDYIEYDNYLKRYVTSYTTTDDNQGEMTESERKQWQAGEINGWTVSCDITVKKFTPKIIGNIKFNK
jgi:conjugal transfer/entry exclusion protein